MPTTTTFASFVIFVAPAFVIFVALSFVIFVAKLFVCFVPAKRFVPVVFQRSSRSSLRSMSIVTRNGARNL